MENMRNALYEILGEALTPHEVIRGARISLRLSQADIVEITGIQRTNLSALENGRTSMTSHYAEMFSAVYDIHPSKILYPNGNIQSTDDLEELRLKAKKYISEKINNEKMDKTL